MSNNSIQYETKLKSLWIFRQFFIGNSNDETNFPHKLLFTNTQVSKIHKAFKNIRFLKTQLSHIIQSGGFIPDPHHFF